MPTMWNMATPPEEAAAGAESFELIFIRSNDHSIDDGDLIERCLADQIAQHGIKVIALL